MTSIPAPAAVSLNGTVRANDPVSRGLIRMDVGVPVPVAFDPGQFAMLNLSGPRAFVFSRPFSILAADGRTVSFLYRVVGRGTRAMADLVPGAPVTVLGPLGRPFGPPTPGRDVVLVAGGVGLPPLAAWLERHGRPTDRAFFGARDGFDVPWRMLGGRWEVSVDDLDGLPEVERAHHGLVTELAALRTGDLPAAADLLACGPVPLLKAAAALASARGWRAWLSLEEHMGCGYGVCKGCVVKVRNESTGAVVRNATCCQDGPVFAAEDLVWPVAKADAGIDATGGSRA